MEPNLKLSFCIFIIVRLTFSLDYCPLHCQCDWHINSVSCVGVEVLPIFHSRTQEVWLVGTKLSFIPLNAFANLANLSRIYIFDDDTLRSLQRHSFHNLSRVMHIQLTGIKTLSYIHQEAFKDLPNLKYLGITNTGLTSFPGLQNIQSSQEDFILEIVENVFIQVIPANSFTGISANALTIDLSETKVQSLPSIGMESIERLQAKRTWALKALPSLSAFPHLQNAELTFSSHCCGLKMLNRWRGHSEAVVCNLTRASSGKLQEPSASFSQWYLGNKISQHVQDIFGLPAADNEDDDLNNTLICPTKLSQNQVFFPVDSSGEHLGEDFDLALCNEMYTDYGPLCTPVPDALNPCEDVMSQGFLRVLVWVVSLFAISANLLVLVILLTCQQKLSVTRFLIGHLAFADGCMGMYLLLISSVDLYTRSRYYQFAITWQTGSGCNLAGMLSVFASELSVYTLTLISLQRWHVIFNAMRPNKKMRLRHAAVLMLFGWVLCVTIALLPVLGINTYERVSICLPMDTDTTVAQAYVISVLMINVIAFTVVCFCYLHIYCMVHNPQYDSSRYDTSMAKRMALLNFTNFLCLAPICFYGLCAAFHQPLMTITDSKVLLVLFYPLNSCVHPFFYAILTKGFHRDIMMLLSRMGLCRRQAILYPS
ncbi:thyrotropin receptor-like isoform 2-T2 [Odontesthes bonariensis]|uniref:thyrotropin receptor-like isoform X2 n=1 Tax=Odontesthes bonariensis TaxID=219752 RepID=UPI003F586A6D